MTARITDTRWPFSGDHITQGTQAYSEAARDAIRALYIWSIDNGISMDEAAAGIGYHRANLHKMCAGKYDGNLDSVADAIWDFLANQQRTRTDSPRPLFIETATSSQIWEVTQAAWDYHTVGAVWGDSQIGKTHALEEFRRRQKPGRVIYVRIPSNGARADIISAIYEAVGISASRVGKVRTAETRNRIFRAIARDQLLIVDEIHELFLCYHKGCKVTTMEFFREIYDRCGCGMLLCGTNVGRDNIEEGPLRGVLEQMRRRCIFTLQLPHYATTADLNAIAAHYGLPRLDQVARDTATDVIRTHGLRAYCIYLDSARQIATNRAEPLTWNHFVTAHDIVAKYSLKKGAK
jgi:DNA transposition AAA+ family ATPase